jgi:hypothetical protein
MIKSVLNSKVAQKCLPCAMRKHAADQAAEFAREEDGVVTAFATFMVLMMCLVGGIGVDLMRNEMERTQVQAVVDRAVLAAADLDQLLDPEEVVGEYFNKAGIGHYFYSVDVQEGLNFKIVNAQARGTTPTMFMSVMGRETLPLWASSSAEERIAKVEISLVVDISGSMAWDNKMENLQDAASTFVDTVLRDETEDLISVSLVPYSEHVNIGPDIFNQMNIQQLHTKSHCVELRDQDYETPRLNYSRRYQQMQHFQWNYDGDPNPDYPIQWGTETLEGNDYDVYAANGGDYSDMPNINSIRSAWKDTEIVNEWNGNVVIDTVCPQFPYEEVKAISQDAEELKVRIGALRPRAGTQIFMGMKWGATLLDPTFRNVTSSMVLQNKVDPIFSSRPAEYDDADTLKTIVLMTDGMNSSTKRIVGGLYNSNSERAHWARYNFNYYTYRYVSSWRRSQWYYTKYPTTQGNAMLDTICDVVKDDGIIVWTIGFEVTNDSADVMRDCASTPSHFFRVEGIEIAAAFEAIARQINQLRLTQ